MQKYLQLTAPQHAWVRNAGSGTFHVYHVVDHTVRCGEVLRDDHTRLEQRVIHASRACKPCLRGTPIHQYEADLRVSHHPPHLAPEVEGRS